MKSQCECAHPSPWQTDGKHTERGPTKIQGLEEPD